jgi:GAF domain-containing protein/HAMP domain-containing protein
MAEAWAVGSLGWVLFVQQAQGEAYAPVDSATRTAFVAVGVFALIAAGLAFIMARVVVAPITDLVGAARQMAAGDLSARALPRRRDETGELAEAFNRMADEVAGTVGSLEQQVNERTADLQQRTTELERLTRNLENAVDESSRRALRLEASAQVSRAIVSVLDPDELLARVVDLIADQVGFYHVGIFLLDDTRRYAVLRAANSAGGQRMLARSHRLEVGEQGIVGYVTDTGRPRIALDVGTDAVFFDNPDLPQTRSEVALPLVARGRILGALDIQSLEPLAFDDEDVTVLGTLADQIAVALDNARLFDEAQAALQEARALQAQYAIQGWRAFAAGREVRPREYTRTGVAPWGDQPLPGIDQVVTTGEMAIIHGDGEGQTLASLIVPIKLHGQTVGALAFQETEPGRVWTADEIALAQAVSDQMVQALESVHLFEDAQRRAWREQTIGQITAQIRAGDEVEEILQIAAQELGRTLGVSRAIVRLHLQEAPEEALS